MSSGQWSSRVGVNWTMYQVLKWRTLDWNIWNKMEMDNATSGLHVAPHWLCWKPHNDRGGSGKVWVTALSAQSAAQPNLQKRWEIYSHSTFLLCICCLLVGWTQLEVLPLVHWDDCVLVVACIGALVWRALARGSFGYAGRLCAPAIILCWIGNRKWNCGCASGVTFNCLMSILAAK